MKPLVFNLKSGVGRVMSIVLWIALLVVIALDLWVLYDSWSIVNAIDTGPAPIQVSRLARINFTLYDEVVKRIEQSTEEIKLSAEQGKFVGPQNPFGIPADEGK